MSRFLRFLRGWLYPYRCSREYVRTFSLIHLWSFTFFYLKRINPRWWGLELGFLGLGNPCLWENRIYVLNTMSPVDNLCSGGFHLIIFKILSQYSCYSTMLNLGYIWRLITTGVGMKLDGPGADKKKETHDGCSTWWILWFLRSRLSFSLVCLSLLNIFIWDFTLLALRFDPI